MRHPIQRRRFEKEFRGLLIKVSRLQRRPKEGLEAKEGRFRQTPPMIRRLFLPLPPPLAPDRPQGQVVDRAQRQDTFDRRVRVDILGTPLRGAAVTPGFNGLLVDPQRETPSAYQGGVILWPVADAVLSLRLHAADLSNSGTCGYSCNNAVVMTKLYCWHL